MGYLFLLTWLSFEQNSYGRYPETKLLLRTKRELVGSEWEDWEKN